MSDPDRPESPDPESPDTEKTRVGNYFVANYPPFSFWTQEQVPRLRSVLAEECPPDRALGLYVHIPFCRKRCDFCYYKVYTDKDSKQIRVYLDALVDELTRYVQQPYLAGRRPRFIYFGGGTPSYLSAEQLQELFRRLQKVLPWDAAEEITFECEPGTLQDKKIQALHELGVTRLSLGIENFDPEILALNNRAHRALEIFRAYEFAREVGFGQINLDLIAGMVGETDQNWQSCIKQSLALAPESVTIYQMEIPYNTTIYRRMKDGNEEVAPVADWATKRRWVAEAFATYEAAGYVVGSAYTVKKNASVQFQYRDALWTGADLLPLGVSSFGHLGGVHVQNEHRFDDYLARVAKGDLPIYRALKLSADEQLIREFILQIKLGRLPLQPFRDKFGVDPKERFREPLKRLQQRGFLEWQGDTIVLSREGLLQVDTLLEDFFLDRHKHARYA